MKLVTKIFSLLAGALLFLLMILTLLDVIGRNFLNHPLPGATEITEIALVVMSFLLFPVVSLQERNIVADVADALNSRILDAIKYILTGIIGGGFFGLVAWRLWILGDNAAGYQDRTPSLSIPLAPVHYVIAALAGVAAVAFVVVILRAATRRFQSTTPSQDHLIPE